MKFAVLGSFGIAEHVIQALRYRPGMAVVLVVDLEDRVGQSVSGFSVEAIDQLNSLDFDKLIIATMDFDGAVRSLNAIGFGWDRIYDEICWEPFLLQIEPTNRCNFNCTNCNRGVEKNSSCDMLRTDDFKRIIDPLPNLKRIQFQGLGEPLLNPELVEMIVYAKARGIATSLTTNGSLLNDNLLSDLIKCTDKLVVSLDAANRDTYENMRRGGNWEQLLRVLKQIASMENESTQFVYNSVIASQKPEEIVEIIDLAYELRPYELHLQLVENWYIPGQPEFSQAHQDLMMIRDKIEPTILSLMSGWKRKLNQRGIRLTYSGSTHRKGRCWWPFFGSFISTSGEMTPCCIRMTASACSFGNLFEAGLESIWTGPAYQNFRKSMFDHHFENTICQFCPM